MKIFIKKYIYIFILILVISVLLTVNTFLTPSETTAPIVQEDNDPVISSSTEPDMSTPITKQERIDHINWTYENGKEYDYYQIGEQENLVVTFYQWKTENESERSGGLLIFKITDKKPQLVWESTNSIHSTFPLIKVMDMTGDGKNELLALWQDGKNDNLNIYQEDNNTFKFITPMHQPGLALGSTTYWPVFVAGDSEIQIEDLDDDQIPEVWFSLEENYVAYKWDGTKYIKWNEQTDAFGDFNSFIN